MMTFLQLLLTGILIGAVYALMSSGLTLVFGVMRVINIAHGAYAIVAAYLTYTLWKWFGLDPLLAIPVLVLAMFGIGWLSYVLIIRHVRSNDISMTVLLTFGIALLLEGVMGILWGNRSVAVRTPYTDGSLHFGPFYVSTVMLIAAGVAVIALAVLGGVLYRTWTGRAIRAASVNEQGALLVGVSVRSIAATTFAIGIGTLGAGGAILASAYPFIPGSHYQWIARLLAIVVLGGLGSLTGAVVGAVIIAVGEQLATQYLGANWVVVVPFLVIFLILIIRPQGILGQRIREDAVA